MATSKINGLYRDQVNKLDLGLTCTLREKDIVSKEKNSLKVVLSPFWKGIYSITKTCLYNFDPLKPHFYIVKWGFTGVDIIFLIAAQNIDCGYSLEPPRRAETWKISEFFIWFFFQFLVVKFSVHLNRRVFVMSKWKIISTPTPSPRHHPTHPSPNPGSDCFLLE